MRHENLRIAARWLILLTGWLGFMVVVFATSSGNGLAWFAAGLVAARVVPRLWRWSGVERQNAPPPDPKAE